MPHVGCAGTIFEVPKMNNFPSNSQDEKFNVPTTSKSQKRKLENDENEAPDCKMPMNSFSNFSNMIDLTGNGCMSMYNTYPNYSNTFNMNINSSENQAYLQNYNLDNSMLQYQNAQNYQGFANQVPQYQGPQVPNFDSSSFFNGSLTDSSYSSNQSNHYLSSNDSGLETSGSQAESFNNDSLEGNLMLGMDGEAETTGIEIAPQDAVIVYGKVLGRMALLNANTEHTVTLAEVKRRLDKPEGMNCSIFGGYMRKAKNKNGGQKIKEQLGVYGITIPPGKRRQAEPTAFTSLTESETNTLVEEFHDLNRTYFPREAFLQQVLVEVSKMENQMKYGQILNQVGNAAGILEHIKFCLEICSNILRRDRSVFEHRGLPLPPNMEPLLPSLQFGLDVYNKITHDFGVRSFHSILQTLAGHKMDDQEFKMGFPPIRDS